jgi:general secretion pathway protein G
MTQPPLPRRSSETQLIVLRPAKTRKGRHVLKPAPKKTKRGGFTLLEIMLVVIIIALLGGAAVYYMGGNVGIAQDTRVKTDLQSISTQLKLYQALNGFLPTTEQGIKALKEKPTTEPIPKQWREFFTKIPQDPYSQDYHYITPGKHNPNSFDLFSIGADRKPGTADDIGNWE